MADYTITVADVKDGFATNAGDGEIQAYIVFVDQADPCMEAAGVPDEIGQAIKVAGVRYLLSMSAPSAQGHTKSERAVSGASRTFGAGNMNPGDSYLQQVRVLDGNRCLLNLLQKNQRISFMSVGRDCNNP